MEAQTSAAAGLRVPLLAPGGLELPSLKGVRVEFQSNEGEKEAAKMALAMMDAGLLDWVEKWNGRAESLLAKRLEELEFPQFSATWSLTDGIDGNEEGRLFLYPDWSGALFFPLHGLIEDLAEIHSSLPATLYKHSVAAVNSWARVYDHLDAMEAYETQAAMDEEAEEVDLKARLPEALFARKRSWKWLQEATAGYQGRFRRAVDLLLELRGLCARKRPKHPFLDGDFNAPVPVIVAAMGFDDEICGAFDTEAQYILEVRPEPAPCFELDPKKPRELAAAFEAAAHFVRIAKVGVMIQEELIREARACRS